MGSIHELLALIFFSTDPPGQPIISGFVKSGYIKSDVALTLTCSSSGGNPLATLSWYKNNKKVYIYMMAVFAQKSQRVLKYKKKKKKKIRRNCNLLSLFLSLEKYTCNRLWNKL